MVGNFTVYKIVTKRKDPNEKTAQAFVKEQTTYYMISGLCYFVLAVIATYVLVEPGSIFFITISIIQTLANLT